MNKNRHIIERNTPFSRVMTNYFIPILIIGGAFLVGATEFLKQFAETGWNI